MAVIRGPAYSAVFCVGGTSTSNACSIEINAVTGTLMLPRLTTTEQDAVPPVDGMLIYNSTTNRVRVYRGAWTSL